MEEEKQGHVNAAHLGTHGGKAGGRLQDAGYRSTFMCCGNAHYHKGDQHSTGLQQVIVNLLGSLLHSGAAGPQEAKDQDSAFGWTLRSSECSSGLSLKRLEHTQEEWGRGWLGNIQRAKAPGV